MDTFYLKHLLQYVEVIRDGLHFHYNARSSSQLVTKTTIAQTQFVTKTPSLEAARLQIDSLIKNKPLMKLVKFNAFFLILITVLCGIFYQVAPPEIPVFFSKPWGQEQLSPTVYVFLIPAALALTFIIQIRIASINIKKNRLISQLTIWAQLVSSILALISVSELIFLLI